MSSNTWLDRAFFCSLILIAGCTSNSALVSHPVTMPQHWENVSGPITGPDTTIWWHAITDPDLKRLIEIGLDNNLTIERSQLTLRRVLTQNKLNLQSQAPLSQASLSLSSVGARDVGRTTSAAGSASVGYTFDLWGNKRRTRELDQIDSQLANADLSQLKWLVSTEVALHYWTGGATAAKIKLMLENLASLDADLAAMMQRAKVGKAVRSEVDAIRLLQEDYLLQIKYFEAQVENSRQQLKTLLGGGSVEFNSDLPVSLAGKSPVLSISAPASLLDRRPDVSSARLVLDAALIQGQIAEKSGYPDLQISANLNSGGEIIRQILSNPISFVGSTLATQYISAKTSRLVAEKAKADVDIAATAFKERVVAALADVEVSFSYAKRIDVAYRANRARRDYSKGELQNVMLRHRVGRASFVDVRRAEREERDATAATIDVALQDWLNYIGTLKALGGPI